MKRRIIGTGLIACFGLSLLLGVGSQVEAITYGSQETSLPEGNTETTSQEASYPAGDEIVLTKLSSLSRTQNQEEIRRIWSSGEPATGLVDDDGQVIAAFYN